MMDVLGHIKRADERAELAEARLSDALDAIEELLKVVHETGISKRRQSDQGRRALQANGRNPWPGRRVL